MPVVAAIMLAISGAIACVVLLIVGIIAVRQWERSAAEIAERRERVLSAAQVRN